MNHPTSCCMKAISVDLANRVKTLIAATSEACRKHISYQAYHVALVVYISEQFILHVAHQ